MSAILRTFKIDGVLTDMTSVKLADPTGTFGVKRNDTGAVVVANDTAMTRTAAGTYQYGFNDPAPGLTYTYSLKFVYNGQTYYVADTFAELAVSPSLSAIETLVGNVLEDAAHAVFSTTIIDQCIDQAIKELSTKVPCESKETVTLSAGSIDVDVSGITGLLEVAKAEYKVDEQPRKFRNVARFGNTITIKTTLNPAANDSAYLYCLKMHTADTLPSELVPIVADLAAGYAAANHIGAGRTQITNASTSLGTALGIIDGLTAKIGAALTSMAAVKTKADAIPTSMGTLLTDITQATTGDIALAMANLTSGLPLINEITIGSTPESQYGNYAMRNLSVAGTRLGIARQNYANTSAVTSHYTSALSQELQA